MRIHLPLEPKHFEPPSVAGPSASPLVHIGGELVLIELQGQLSWEGDRSGKVIGLLGLERPDKPTLHLGEHHLLHGKIASLQNPYAVIRRVYGGPSAVDIAAGDDEGEEEEDKTTPQKRSKGTKEEDEEEEEDEPPLFPPEPTTTPSHDGLRSSSPVYPSSAVRDYSSELDLSSPARWDVTGDDEEEEEEEERRLAEEAKRRQVAKRKEKRKREEKERTRHYEVVGVVRKKAVFALRPEPIVTATVLPE